MVTEGWIYFPWQPTNIVFSIYQNTLLEICYVKTTTKLISSINLRQLDFNIAFDKITISLCMLNTMN